MPRVSKKPFKYGTSVQKPKRARKQPDGAGVMDFLRNPRQRLRKALSGPRDSDYAPKVRTLLSKIGGREITALYVYRSPINSALDKALDFVSMGSWSKAKQKHSFDKFFHLGLMAEYMDDEGHIRRALIERLEHMSVSVDFKQEAEAQYMPVDLGNRRLTINGLLDGARQKLGDKSFFDYRALDGRNCQDMVLCLLEQSGLLTPKLKDFVYQDIRELVKDLSFWTRHVANAATGIASIYDHNERVL